MNSQKKSSKIKSTAGDKFLGQMISTGVADDAFIKDIVSMFLEEGNITIQQLKKAFEKQEIVNIKLFSHKLKSSFLMFDMERAHFLVTKFENVSSNTINECIIEFNELELLWNESVQELDQKYLH